MKNFNIPFGKAQIEHRTATITGTLGNGRVVHENIEFVGNSIPSAISGALLAVEAINRLLEKQGESNEVTS